MTQAAASHLWTPSFGVLRGGTDHAKYPVTGVEFPVRWSFEILDNRSLPISSIHCRMEALGLETHGYGDAFFLKSAMTCALAEAWERFWMKTTAKTGRPDIPQFRSSNGFAAGRSAEDALSASRRELIERAMLLQAWETQAGWNPFRLFDPLAKIFLAPTELAGWSIRFFSLTDPHMGHTLTALGQHPRLGACFDSVFAGSRISGKVQRKLAHSVQRMISYCPETHDPDYQLPDSGGPNEHSRYYRDPGNGEAFEFLTRPECQRGNVILPEPERIESRILVDGGNFPAVAMSFHPTWKALSWGKNSIGGGNPWPHPLA